MATQTYMTAKLNLADGTIVYPQISLDNIVRSISDPTLVTVAELSGGKVPIAQLPTTLTVTDSNNAVPTAGAVYGALNTKQATLVEGDNIIHIINGSTIMADITNLDVAGIDQTATNGVHLVLDGNTVSAAADLAANESAGVLAGASDGVKLVNGVAQFDNTTVDAATPADIIAGTANKVIQADDLDTALRANANIVPSIAYMAKRWLWTSFGTNPSMAFDEAEDMIVWTDTVPANATNVSMYLRNCPNVSNVEGSFLVYCDVYIETAAVTDLSLRHAYNTAYLANVTGSSVTHNTAVKNTWTRIGGIMTQSGSNTAGPLWVVEAPAGTTFTVRIRNLRIVTLASVPEAQRAAWMETYGSFYESGAGIVVNGRKIAIDEATPGETLVGTDSTGALIHDKTLTPGSLKSALSTGQAVDCTAVPWCPSWTIYEGDNTSTTVKPMAEVYRDTFTLKRDTNSGISYLGFYEGYIYPKAGQIDGADGTKIPLEYLFTAEITNNGTTAVRIRGNINTATASEQGRRDMWSNVEVWKPGETRKISFIFPAKFNSSNVNITRALLYIDGNTTAPYSLTFKKLRQFEVMALTDDARMHLAEPDTDVTDVNSFYLIKNDMVDPWVNIINMGSAPSITIASGLAYKATVVSGATTTLSTDTVPANTYGKDAHMSLFVGATGTVICQPPLNLITPLTPGAGHNITIKYRDGQANMYVDDTDIGYVVSVAEGTDQGTFIYGYTTSTSEYIVFAPGVDGSTVTMPDNQDLSLRKVNVLGNGPENTIITGSSVYSLNANTGNGVASNSKCIRLSNLTLKDVTVEPTEGSNGFYIQEASNCVFDNVSLTENASPVTTTPLEFRGPVVGSTITNSVKQGQWAFLLYPGPMQDCLVTGNTLTYQGAYADWNGNVTISGSTFTDNIMSNTYALNDFGVVYVPGVNTVISGCYFNNPGLSRTTHHGVEVWNNGTVSISGSTFEARDDIHMRGTTSTVYFNGDNIVGSTVHGYGTVIPANNSHTDGNGTGVIDLADMQEKTLYRYIPQNVELSNVTIKNGQGKAQSYFGAAGTKEGGGLYIQSAAVGSDLYSVVLRNVTITGCTAAFGSAIGMTERCWIELYNCCFEGNYSTYHGTGAAQYDGALFFGTARNTHDIIISGCTFGADQNVSVIAASANFKFRISGYNYCKNTIRTSMGGANPWVLEDNTTIDMTGSAYNTFFDQAGVDFFIGNNVTFKGANNGVGTIDACKTHTVYATRPQLSTVEITAPAKEPWIIKDMTIALNVYAHEAYTMKYVGRNWQSGRYISPLPARIQIAANAIMDLRSNSNSVIWAAGLMVVGDDVTAPTGSAGVCAVDGSTSNISGIGTYIGASGTNDFVALSKVIGVSTNSAFDTALTSTTQADGTNKFIQTASGSTCSVSTTASTTLNGLDKVLFTSDYKPLWRGSAVLGNSTTLTVDNDEATVIVTGQFRTTNLVLASRIDFGTASDDETPVYTNGSFVIGGGTGSVIEGAGPLAEMHFISGNASISSGGNTATVQNLIFSGDPDRVTTFSLFVQGANSIVEYNNVTFKDNKRSLTAEAELGGGFYGYYPRATFNNCVFQNNEACYGGGVNLKSDEAAQLSWTYGKFNNCVFEGNKGGSGRAWGMCCTFTPVTITGCTFGTNQDIRTRFNADIVNVNDGNTIFQIGAMYGNASYRGNVRILKNTTNKLSVAGTCIEGNPVSVGSYETVNNATEWVVGGTAAVIFPDGTTHHFSGTGTYIAGVKTGNVYTDLTQID